jgi:hypothetical protein
MHVLVVCVHSVGARSTIHLVDETGALAWSGGSVLAALSWLCEQGEDSVVGITDDGPELFLIERCGCPTMTLPSLSLRRAHYGGCSDLPKLPGLSPDPTLRARGLADDPETLLEQRRRRADWVRRATGPAANDNPRPRRPHDASASELKEQRPPDWGGAW